MSNLIILECEYCGQPTDWDADSAAAGVSPCCPDCKAIPATIITILVLVALGALGLLLWGVFHG